MKSNFHLKNGYYFRLTDENVFQIVKANDFDAPGEVLVEMELGEFASIVASTSPRREGEGSWHYILDFLQNGTMFCGGCGLRMPVGGPPVIGPLSILPFPVCCNSCYEQKFKPMFDWGMEQSKR